MTPYYELMVQINGEKVILDTFGDGEQIKLSLNYQINDITDISTKNSSYSLNISLPDSKVNRDAFEYIFLLNSNSEFDAGRKSRCWVFKDTLVVFEGVLQLTEIDYDLETRKQFYQCALYADNSNLFNDIGEKYLTDLDLGDLNHNFTASNIINSWTADYSNGYYYGFMDYGGYMSNTDISDANGLNIMDFKPAIYVKPLIDQIFSTAGSQSYYYESDFLNSDLFKKLVLPFNNADLTPGVYKSLRDVDDVIVFAYPNAEVIPEYVGGSTEAFISWSCNTKQIDPNDFYDIDEHVYTAPSLPLMFTQRFMCAYDFTLGTASTGTGATGPWTAIADDVWIIFKRSMYPDGTLVSNFSDTPTYAELLPAGVGHWPYIPIGGNPYYSIRDTITPTYLGDSLWRMTDTFNSAFLNGTPGVDYDQPLRAGEQVRIFFMRYATGFGIEPLTELQPYTSYIKMYINPNMMDLSVGLSGSNLVPSNVKQKDLLKSINSMFNLVYEPSKTAPNTFRIEPRDDYYEKYKVIKDWSGKLDISKPIKSKITSNSQKKVNFFSHKTDKDYYNTTYTAGTNEIFGQYQYFIDNDFIKDTNNITTIFSPTPLDRLLGSNNIYLTRIIANNNNNSGANSNTSQNNTDYSGMNIRILYANIFGNLYDTFKFNLATYSYYPLMAPMNDPENPAFILNFGDNDASYTRYNGTNNTLFNNYWLNTMEAVSDKNARTITAYVYLKSTDISQFYFSDVIFMTFNGQDSYYRVNKIINYDPAFDGSTQVEFIKL